MAYVISTLPHEIRDIISQNKADLEARDHHKRLIQKIDNELHDAIGNRVERIIEHLKHYIDDYNRAESDFKHLKTVIQHENYSVDDVWESTELERCLDVLDYSFLKIHYYVHILGYLFCTRPAEEYHTYYVEQIKRILKKHRICIFE